MELLQGLKWSRQQRIILFSLLFIVVLRFAFIGLMGLMPQDAYYYFYSEHPALSYYDHPPAIAFLIRAGTEIFGDNPFGVRVSGVLLSLPVNLG